MKLYMRNAACSLSPHIVCRELDLAVDLVPVDRGTQRVPDGTPFSAINGNGYVPVLEIEDGIRLTEGPAIVQYLADLKPQAGLAPPAGTLDRVRLQAGLNFIASELHKPLAMQLNPVYAASHDALAAHARKRFDWLADQFAGPYLLGEAYSVADPYLFVCLNWTQFINLDLTPWPVLLAFMRRVAVRPAVQQALAAEGLLPSDESGAFFTPLRAAAQ